MKNTLKIGGLLFLGAVAFQSCTEDILTKLSGSKTFEYTIESNEPKVITVGTENGATETNVSISIPFPQDIETDQRALLNEELTAQGEGAIELTEFDIVNMEIKEGQLDEQTEGLVESDPINNYINNISISSVKDGEATLLASCSEFGAPFEVTGVDISEILYNPSAYEFRLDVLFDELPAESRISDYLFKLSLDADYEFTRGK